MKLNPYLFWDSDPSKLDYENNARLIIERVVTRGTLDDWREIRNYYGMRRIKEECMDIRSLSYKNLIFLSTILKVPIKLFRCYTNLSSDPELYPF